MNNGTMLGGVRPPKKAMTGVHQLEQHRQVYSVEGARATRPSLFFLLLWSNVEEVVRHEIARSEFYGQEGDHRGDGEPAHQCRDKEPVNHGPRDQIRDERRLLQLGTKVSNKYRN